MTLGTMDGANVEIVQEVGDGKCMLSSVFHLMKLSAYENEGGYDPMEIFNNSDAGHP